MGRARAFCTLSHPHTTGTSRPFLFFLNPGFHIQVSYFEYNNVVSAGPSGKGLSSSNWRTEAGGLQFPQYEFKANWGTVEERGPRIAKRSRGVAQC